MTTQYRSKALRRLAHVFAGAEAGVYTLPERISDARAALDRLDAEQERLTKVPAVAHDAALVDEITEAAKAGKKFPNPDQLAQAEQNRRARDTYNAALNQARELLEDNLENAVVGSAELLITESLRPVLGEVMAEATDLAAALAGHGTDHRALLGAPEPVRQARLRFDHVATRYLALRNAQTALSGFSPPADEGGRFAELRNFDTLTAGYRPGVLPWPTDNTVAKLVWFAQHDADVWMPTVTERQARFADHLATRLNPAVSA